MRDVQPLDIALPHASQYADRNKQEPRYDWTELKMLWCSRINGDSFFARFESHGRQGDFSFWKLSTHTFGNWTHTITTICDLCACATLKPAPTCYYARKSIFHDLFSSWSRTWCVSSFVCACVTKEVRTEDGENHEGGEKVNRKWDWHQHQARVSPRTQNVEVCACSSGQMTLIRSDITSVIRNRLRSDLFAFAIAPDFHSIEILNCSTTISLRVAIRELLVQFVFDWIFIKRS